MRISLNNLTAVRSLLAVVDSCRTVTIVVRWCCSQGWSRQWKVKTSDSKCRLDSTSDKEEISDTRYTHLIILCESLMPNLAWCGQCQDPNVGNSSSHTRNLLPSISILEWSIPRAAAIDYTSDIGNDLRVAAYHGNTTCYFAIAMDGLTLFFYAVDMAQVPLVQAKFEKRLSGFPSSRRPFCVRCQSNSSTKARLPNSAYDFHAEWLANF